MKVITTFAAKHWTDGLAKEMVTSFLRYWKGFELCAYVNSGMPPGLADLPITVIDHYAHDRFLTDFIRTYEKVIHPLIWRDGRYDYKWDACRFAHKVFALHDASQTCRQDLVWLDADVISHARVTPHDILNLTEDFHDVAYLGRQNYSPETGFLWFNRSRAGSDVIAAVHRYYSHRTVFNEPEWHDGYLWGEVIPKFAACNLSEGIPDKHVWPKSPLGKFCSHLKGPARKRAGADLPDAVAMKQPDAVTAETVL